jgi:2-keto-4-pentenoate hydratase/2-oxohepta-3-ene-1,7-dioic acid hydratase in catechol pathway
MRYGAMRRQPNLVRFVRLEGGSDGELAQFLDAPPWLGGRPVGETATIGAQSAMLACPVQPSKIVCIGRNYAAHARELGNQVPAEPLLFLKPPSSLLGPQGTVLLPSESSRVEHEAELAVVIGHRAKDVAEPDALAHVFGYTCACDVTARDLQRKDVQFTRAKGFDTFCPVGPWVETDLDVSAARVTCRVNHETRQDGTTADMIFDVPTLVSYVSRVMTLEPGDVLLTGTPAGVGPLAAGDALEVEVGGVGILQLRVERSDSPARSSGFVARAP